MFMSVVIGFIVAALMVLMDHSFNGRSLFKARSKKKAKSKDKVKVSFVSNLYIIGISINVDNLNIY